MTRKEESLPISESLSEQRLSYPKEQSKKAYVNLNCKKIYLLSVSED